MTMSLSACESSKLKKELEDASRREQIAKTALEQLDKTRELPKIPSDCYKREKTGIVLGDRLDVAQAKTEDALDRTENRLGRCVRWYDRLRISRSNL